jgi:hypothetical protein
MMRVLFAILLASILTASLGAPAQAQDWFWGVAWGVTQPLDDTEKFIGNTSYRNFSLEGKKLAYGASAGFGLSFGWTVFDEKVYDTVELKPEDGSPAGDVTGTQFRYMNIFPLLVTADLYLGRPYTTRLFLGVAAGAYIIEERVEMGFFLKDEDNWHFGGAPEVGIGFPLGETTLFFLGRYNYILESGNVGPVQYAQIMVGLGSN